MRLDEKARESLEAAERLLPDESGRDALSSSAASRAYYAAYLAVADRALREGRAFTNDERSYFRHDQLPDDARRWGLLDEEQALDLEWMLGLRIKADYLEDFVELEEASDAFDRAKLLLTALTKRADDAR